MVESGDRDRAEREQCDAEYTCFLEGEIKRLEKLVEAAVRLLRKSERIAWSWNPTKKCMGYYLDHNFIGTTCNEVIAAEAAGGDDA